MNSHSTLWKFPLRVATPTGEEVQFFLVNLDRFPRNIRAKLIRIKEAEEALVAATRAMPEPPKDMRNWDALSYLKMFQQTFEAVRSELEGCLNFLNPHVFGNRTFGYAKHSPEEEIQVLHSHLCAIMTEYESARNAAAVLSSAVD